MKWIIITGTWRALHESIEADVRATVRSILSRGDGIITGGATGVDFYAMEEAFACNPSASHIRTIIPASLEAYIADYHANWCANPITTEHIDALHTLLSKLKHTNPAGFLEMPHEIIDQSHYDARNLQEVLYGDAVCAFQVKNSTGTQHTIDAARAAGLVIELHKQYTISF